MPGPASHLQRNKLPAEFALAIACCRWAYSAEGGDDACNLATGVNWGQFLATCRRHRVQGMAWHSLQGLGITVPAPVQIAIAGDARTIAEQGLRAAQECKRLKEAFEAAAVPLLFLKGLTIGKLAYGNPFLKMAWDIDILVEPANLLRAATLLDGLGYRVECPSDLDLLQQWHRLRKDSAWLGPSGLFVELHDAVVDQPDLLSGISVSSPAQIVPITANIALPTFADGELFSYLCAHGASSAWFRLKWLADLAGWLHHQAPDRIVALYARSRDFGVDRHAAQALLLAQRLFGIQVPQELTDSIDRPVNRWLARAALRQMLKGEPTERLFGTLAIHLTQFLLRPGVRHKMREFRRQMRLALSRP